MRIIKKKGLLAGVFLMLLSSLWAIVNAQEATSSVLSSANIVVPQSIFVRSGPSESYVAVGALYAGDSVTPLNLSLEGDWVLIVYRRGTGWVRRGLINWQPNSLSGLDTLEPDITPTSANPPTATPFLPTATPEGNWVSVTNSASAYVRAGPGRGYLRVGDLLLGATVEPIARNDDATWVMIRFADENTDFDGFGWVDWRLVNWAEGTNLRDLPSVDPNNLTPTATFTASSTPSVTVTASTTPSATVTASATPSMTVTASATPSVTVTASATPSATVTASATPSATVTASATPSATATASATPSATVTASITPSATVTASITPSATVTASITPNATATEKAILPVPPPTATPVPSKDVHPPSTPVIPQETILAGLFLVGLFGYVAFYWRALNVASAYQRGFVVKTCPVCRQGTLYVDDKPERVLGIPRTRRTVRCNHCRSVLREVGNKRWRYAIDPLENALMYERLNGRAITDEELVQLAKVPNAFNQEKPSFVDEENT